MCTLANKASNGLHLALSPAKISDKSRTFVSLSQNFKSQIHSVIPTEMLSPKSKVLRTWCRLPRTTFLGGYRCQEENNR